MFLIPMDRLRILYHAKTEKLKLLTEFSIVLNWSYQKLLQQRDAVTFNEKSTDILKHAVIKIKHKALVKKRFCENEIESWISLKTACILASCATIRLSEGTLHQC
jgi:hypothetical protein